MSAKTEPSVDVLAAQVRDALIRGEGCCHVNDQEWTREWWSARLAALDALVARVTEAERLAHVNAQGFDEHEERADRLEAALADARNALEQYANPQHWALDRTDLAYPKCIWIGPGADERVPNAPKAAREVLERLDGNSE